MNTLGSSPKIDPAQKSWWLGFGLILGFWLLVLTQRFPAPLIDDASYIGAGINLAQHGIYSNPLCVVPGMLEEGEPFFIYMPLHSYVLAGWLLVAGINTFSFQLYSTFIAAAVTLLAYRFFPARTGIWICGPLLSLVVYGLLGGTGLRPDGLGLLFLLLGLDAYRARSPGSFFLKNLFLGLTLITYPSLALLVLFLSGASLLYLQMIGRRTIRELIPWALAMGTAYLACFLLFLVCIDGRLPEFLQKIALAQEISGNGVASRLHLFTTLGVAKWIAIQAGFLALALTFLSRWRNDPRRRGEVFLLLVSLVTFVLLGYSSLKSATGSHVWAFACLVAALLLLARENWTWRAMGIWLMALAVAAFGHAHIAIEHLLADAPPGPERRTVLLAEITRLQPARLYLDTYAMRTLYDYRLPPNAFCYETANTGKKWYPPVNVSTLPPHSVCVVSVKSAFPTSLSPEAGQQARPLEIGGHRIPGVWKNPYELELMDNR